MSRRPVVLQNYPSLHPVLDELLAEDVDLVTAPSSETGDLIAAGEGAVAIIARGPGRVSREVLETLDTVRFVVAPGSGTDAVSLDDATQLGIAVVNHAGIAPQPVAEYVVGAIVTLLKKLREADRLLRAGLEWSERDWLLRGGEASGRTLGLIGFGHIGRDVARRAAHGLDMTVIAYDPVVPDRAFQENAVERVDLDQLLERSDVVSVHVPLLPATRQLIGAAQLATMKPHAILINTSRGEVVDQRALTEVLVAGRLAGAALDVLDPEPPARDDDILQLDQVLVTPHIAGMTHEGMERLCRATAQSVRELLRGVRPTRLVNDVAWPPPRAASQGFPLGP